jgi:proline racemase
MGAKLLIVHHRACTSARMAQWYAKGKLKKGNGIGGRARVYGYNTITIDPEDPYGFGFSGVIIICYR